MSKNEFTNIHNFFDIANLLYKELDRFAFAHADDEDSRVGEIEGGRVGVMGLGRGNKAA